MFGTIFITPAIDMLIFALVAYAAAYIVYATIYKKDFVGVSSVDLKFSIILLLLVIAYYYESGVDVTVWGVTVHWLVYYLFISGVIEIAYFIIYKTAVGLRWKDIMKQVQ